MSEHILKKLQELADKDHDGHFTVMRFTTNWRVGFGTPDCREDIDTFCSGRSFEEAALEAIYQEGQRVGRI